MKKVLIFEQYEMDAIGIKKILNQEPQLNVDATICEKQFKNLLGGLKYDAYLINLNVLQKIGLGMLDEILKMHRDAKILILLTSDIRFYFNELINKGVSGFVSRSYSEKQFIYTVWSVIEELTVIPINLLSDIRMVENKTLVGGKETSFSKIEVEILMLCSKGMINREIAVHTYMSQRNVERYLSSIYKKLRVNSRLEAISKAEKLGLIPKLVLI